MDVAQRIYKLVHALFLIMCSDDLIHHWLSMKVRHVHYDAPISWSMRVE